MRKNVRRPMRIHSLVPPALAFLAASVVLGGTTTLPPVSDSSWTTNGFTTVSGTTATLTTERAATASCVRFREASRMTDSRRSSILGSSNCETLWAGHISCGTFRT